ncbi:cellulase family glycosylhydrolase [Algibacillus agarilyticus]|uniref:cellulase family glycosylhydrolase n=1 Tax=Algibacillus agarilyticus TaxID=2234133 RepID=UPI000DCF9FEF|nr:cellulase family glycosylhydrolase [Algibacillus agarilyticus]
MNRLSHIKHYQVAVSFLLGSLATIITHSVNAETKSAYVEEGVVYEADGQEMKRFGVNYNTPFAYGYRALNKLGLNHKASIDMDVDHIARLGLDAYRVHIWDREISDSEGNLIDNHHLELFDYLMLKLEQHNIKVILTPIAWWGNGYPEPDQPTDGFAQHFEKHEMNQNNKAIAYSTRYLAQLMQHKNRYTGKTIGQDDNVIIFELFNEPRHPGKTDDSRQYVNTLIKSMRETGVTKPLFYNISEQGGWTEFADAICQSNIDGISYQWYPTGLIKMSRLNTNVLPNVAKYTNPFSHLEACQSKGKMIYEFDAADSTRSVMYPAMARSFRAEGFQWATQFAYDPAETAHTNSEYNTHYMNLLYTPNKALGLMIAGEAFRQLPRHYQQAEYPENNQFEDFSIDYHQDLSVLNQPGKFYYSASNTLKPAANITAIAGVGNSKLVQYQGSGAYFLDQIKPGEWRLEVYPDVIKTADPHLPGSLKRTVAKLFVAENKLSLNLADLHSQFHLQGINAGNHIAQLSQAHTVHVKPGVYAVSNKKLSAADLAQYDADFYLPHSTIMPNASSNKAQVKQTVIKPSIVWHQPQRHANIGENTPLTFDVVGNYNPEAVKFYLRYLGHDTFTELETTNIDSKRYQVMLPTNWTNSGILEYALAVNTKGNWTTYPGLDKGRPTDWDFATATDFWRVEYRPTGSLIEIFNAAHDHHSRIYPKRGRARWDFIAGDNGLNQAFKLGIENLQDDGNWLLRSALAENNPMSNRDLAGYKDIVIKIKSHNAKDYINFALINQAGLAFGKTIEVTNRWQYKVIPLNQLEATTTMLTKSYPMFMPAEYPHTTSDFGELTKLQGFQIQFDASQYRSSQRNKWHGIEIEMIGLMKR